MPTFDNVMVAGNHWVLKESQVDGNMTLDSQFQVNGNVTMDQQVQFNENVTFDGDLQINENVTIDGDLQVNGSLTIDTNFEVNGSQTIINHLDVGGDATANHRIGAIDLPTLPAGAPTIQQVLFFATTVVSQPGLLLKGTDGNNYIVFIDTTGGSPNIAIQKA